MTTPLERIAQYEARAQALLDAGFTTKSSQKDAKEYAGRAYSQARDLAFNVFRDIPHAERTEAHIAAYDALPFETHNFRPKHATLVRANLPAAAEFITIIERIVSLYAAIKAAPVTPKPVVKLNDAGQPVHRSNAFNPELREQFLAQAPALTASYAKHVRDVFTRYAADFGVGDTIPCDLYPGRNYKNPLTEGEANQQAVVQGFLGPHCDIIGTKIKLYSLSEEKLAREAERYGLMVALEWFYKTNLKLGQLVAPMLVSDNHSGEVIVTGGKADGSKVELRQQRITKWAPVSRRVFSQFPSRLYVNGQFHEERAYVERFGA